MNMNTQIEAKYWADIERLGHPSVEVLGREIARRERGETYRRLAYYLLTAFLAAAAAIVLITNLWLSVLQIDGTSMNPLLRVGEVVLAVRSDNPEKKEIIAFRHNNKLFVKRVIAIAGDRVDIQDDGTVLVNGNALSEPYIAGKSFAPCDIELPFHVPAGTVFVLGDNRPAARDSRDSRFGPVGREEIIGKVIWRMWPLSRLGGIKQK